MTTETIELVACDVSGQKKAMVEGISCECTVEELIKSLVPAMSLPQTDSQGQEILYQMLLEREERHLNGSETVGESLKPKDTVVLHPNIDAGRGSKP